MGGDLLHPDTKVVLTNERYDLLRKDLVSSIPIDLSDHVTIDQKLFMKLITVIDC